MSNSVLFLIQAKLNPLITDFNKIDCFTVIFQHGSTSHKGTNQKYQYSNTNINNAIINTLLNINIYVYVLKMHKNFKWCMAQRKWENTGQARLYWLEEKFGIYIFFKHQGNLLNYGYF